MRQISLKRNTWLKDYRNILQNTTPSHCARCGALGGGWVPKGSMEPHHPFYRESRAFVAAILPMCSECHEWIHANTKLAKEDGWLIRPKSKQERDEKNKEK